MANLNQRLARPHTSCPDGPTSSPYWYYMVASCWCGTADRSHLHSSPLAGRLVPFQRCLHGCQTGPRGGSFQQDHMMMLPSSTSSAAVGQLLKKLLPVIPLCSYWTWLCRLFDLTMLEHSVLLQWPIGQSNMVSHIDRPDLSASRVSTAVEQRRRPHRIPACKQLIVRGCSWHVEPLQKMSAMMLYLYLSLQGWAPQGEGGCVVQIALPGIC